MLDITEQPCVWPEELKPYGAGELIRAESFDTWWDRCGDGLSHLSREICEQWPYKHWDQSPYSFIPLNQLSWKLEEWKTERIIQQVAIEYGLITDEGHRHCSAEWDYKVMNEYDNKKHDPALTMNQTGTWNIPIVVIFSPFGFKCGEMERKDIHYWLIEGHKRFRYLNALSKLGKNCKDKHLVYVLTLN